MRLNRQFPPLRHTDGVTLIEVLVTIVVLAFGLLGLAGLQSKLNVGVLEAYDRSQAVVLLNNLSERMEANHAHASDYVVQGTLGTNDSSMPDDCSTLTTRAQKDLCEWSQLLKGAAETRSSTNVGAMSGARGCITQVQAPNSATGICAPGIYRITVAWQGDHATSAPAVACGMNSFGDEKYRRAISTLVSVGLPTCQ